MKNKFVSSTLIAFWLNFSFSIVEFIFGTLFQSAAILADAVHDMGDALAIGLSYFLEKISKKKGNDRFSLGYDRFALLGAMVTSVILIVGSIFVLVETVPRLFNPPVVDKIGMLLLGVIAIVINAVGSFVLSEKSSENEEVLSLHFLEDILGWIAVIIVALVLQVTDWYFLDPLLSVAISIFILSKALPRFWKNFLVFMEAVPADIDLQQIENEVETVEHVKKVVDLSVWSLDGRQHVATLHLWIDDAADEKSVRQEVVELLHCHNIVEATVQFDQNMEEHQEHCRKVILSEHRHQH
ncbi:cation diffusion facilitator family transporter [Streptococcus gallinaceus]|uniref:Cobalt-zinc-cadmium efflux system protein n=1 Tax=Streptococcus gallinaceus TaxID=165758 RepID=A0ABV2JNM1_9STRE